MSRVVKQEPGAKGKRGIDAVSDDSVNPVQARKVMPKREPGTKGKRGREAVADDSANMNQQGMQDRRVIRSRYQAVKTRINDEKEDLYTGDSDKFGSIISEVEKLHTLVQKPREQVADAEALLDIANNLVASVKSHTNEGVTPTEFVNGLLSNFGHQSMPAEDTERSILWKDIGFFVSNIFRSGYGCRTMLGPMNTELKQRKAVVQRRRTKPTENACPEEVADNGEEKTDTDKNMAIMFEILRKKRRVRLESIMLNRKSFSQTVENTFALSFLLKDGRAEITVDENGSHFVSPKNAPAADSILSGKVSYSHFAFRFDFKDWKLMMNMDPPLEELMPHRTPSDMSSCSESQPNAHPQDTDSREATTCITPIRKFSRNRGLIIHEDSVVDDSPEVDAATAKGSLTIRDCKRRL